MTTLTYILASETGQYNPTIPWAYLHVGLMLYTRYKLVNFVRINDWDKASFRIVQAMIQIGAPLEEKYHSPPYDYTLVDIIFEDSHTESSINTFNELYGLMQEHGQFVSGKLALGELKDEWSGSN